MSIFKRLSEVRGTGGRGISDRNPILADPARRRPAACWRRGARTQRKPLLSFLFSGWFLFRFAERRFLAEFK